MTKRLLVLLFALLVPAACSDDGGDAGEDGGDGRDGDEPAEEALSDEEQEYADAITVTMRDEEDGFGASREEARCMSEAMMAELGTAPFEDAGVTPADIEADAESTPGELLGDGAISDAQADAIIEAWDGCTDLNEVFAAAGASEFELTEDEESCFADGLEESGLGRDLLKTSLTSSEGEPDATAISDMLGLLGDCGEDGGPVVRAMAEGMMAESNLDEEQALCIAQGLLDEIGLEDLGAFSEGDVDRLDAETQNTIGAAVLEAAQACDVPLSALGGG